MTRIEKLEARLNEAGKLMARWSKRLTDAENAICKAVPELNRLGKKAHRLQKQIQMLKREAKRKPKAGAVPTFDDALGF